jgi:hypothetical protein
LKKLVYIILISLSFFGCSKNDELSPNLRVVLLNYQKKFPFPTDNKSKSKCIFVYSAYFWKKNQDTLLVLTRSSSGILPNLKGFGIYRDDNLKPTFILDENKLGDRFILKKINQEKEEFYWLEKSFKEGFPPLYTYSIKNKELKLIAIDTVWKSWD